ncbi:MAG: alpha/beta fold hydrolase [Porphyromonadaceae bacterium]|nr:alpha/beta fold hydrolase [Porphyromonadaceae bacterium]
MSKIFYTTILFLVMTFLLKAGDITGNWEGMLTVQQNNLRIVFHVHKTDSILTSTMDSPDQGAFGLPTTRCSFGNNRLEIVATGLGLFYQGTLQGDSIVGTFHQGGIPFPLVLKRSEKPIFDRPQTPREPLPYISEEVIITQPDDSISLSGTLTLPDSTGIFPAILLIAGSGPNDRDETIFGHKPFFVISDHLTRNGFAVLRYDKRGVGKSTGDFDKATIRDFADDAAMAVKYLKQRKEVDAEKIGILGHSEGGLVAPIVASGETGIRMMVLLAAPGTTGIEIVLDQNEVSMQQQAMEPENIEKLQMLNREMFESLLTWDGSENQKTALRDRLLNLWKQLPLLVTLKMNKESYLRSQFNAMIKPGYRSFLAIDPAKSLEKVSCDVLAINGENDLQVPADKNLAAIEKALEKGGNKRFELKKYPLLNHLFQESVTGRVDEYGKISQTISPEVLSDITNWLKKEVEVK